MFRGMVRTHADGIKKRAFSVGILERNDMDRKGMTVTEALRFYMVAYGREKRRGRALT